MKIKTDQNTFPNVIVAYLYDKLMNPDTISPDNTEFDIIMDKIKKSGVMPLLRHYYLNMDAEYRVKYRLIKKSLTDEGTSMGLIQIIPKEAEKEKEGLIKKVVKKAIKSLKSSEEFDDTELQLLTEIISLEEDSLNG